jgi:hypothetical protein
VSGERPKLWLVTDDTLEGALEAVDDDLHAGEGPAPNARPSPKHKRLSRIEVDFAMVPLPWLRDHTWYHVFPARTRLYLYLQYKSRRGTKVVRLTNDMAKEIGLAKQNKMRDLRLLEAEGFVTVLEVDRADSITVQVAVIRQPGLPP